MTDPRQSDVKDAILKGAIIDAVLIGAGFVIYLTTDQWAWLVGGAVLGSAAFLLLLAQAGAFARKP